MKIGKLFAAMTSGLMISLALAACNKNVGGDGDGDKPNPPKPQPTRVEEIMSNMTLEQKIAQMMMPDFRQWQQKSETEVTDFTVMNPEIEEIIKKYDFGGVILFANNVKGTEQTFNLTRDLQRAQLSDNEVPLYLSIDQEGGIVWRLGSGTTLPGNMALGAVGSEEDAKKSGALIASEISSLGLNVNFAPSLDVNSNPANPVIGLRAFSDDPQAVAKLGVSMIQGMQEHNVAVTAKHFPGHGDTATDSHVGLPIVNKSYDELLKQELVPFQAAFDNGVDMVMTAHIQLPQIEKDKYRTASGEEIYIPATLSDDIITGVLREKMKYDGVVSTDAMNMDAISKNFGELEACKMAIKADVDILLMPTVLRNKEDMKKMDNLITGIASAVNSGEISLEEIDDSVKRILTNKEERGILDYNENDLSLENANKTVGSKEHKDYERDLAAKAITVVKNENNVLPLNVKSNEKVAAFAMSVSRLNSYQLGINRVNEALGSKVGQVESLALGWAYTDPMLKIIDEKIKESTYVIFLSELWGIPTDDDANVLYGQYIVKKCKELGKKSIILSINIPYEITKFEDADALLACYGYVGMDPTEAGQIIPDYAYAPNIAAGVEVMFGNYAATGKLPINIPEFINGSYNMNNIIFNRGFGLTYPKRGE